MTSDAPSQSQRRDDMYRAILLERRARLEARLGAIEDDFEQPRNPDDDDRAVERNNDEVLDELGQTAQNELAAISAALTRLEKGTFGHCVKCGNPIDDQRLEAVPHTPFCRSCVSPD